MKALCLVAVPFLLTFTSSSSHAAGTCQQFAGTYSAGNAGCFVTLNGGRTYTDTSFSGMVISTQTSNDGLSMEYQFGAEGSFTVNYVADGNEHTGDDVNSGAIYITSCDLSEIKSLRDGGSFVGPYYTTFIKNSDGTYTLTESTMNDYTYVRSCSMIRTP